MSDPTRSEDTLISRYKLLAACRAATPGRQWSTEAIDALKAIGEAYVGDIIVSITPETNFNGKSKRITLEHISAATQQRESAYVAWLEEVNEVYAKALRQHGALPKTRPAPLPTKRGGA